jgi:cytidylate kinase
MSEEKFIVAIDGPTASGKGTVAQKVASSLGYEYVDTGAIYRTVGYLAIKKGVSFDDAEGLISLLVGLRFEFKDGEVFVNGESFNQFIRNPEIGKVASEISHCKDFKLAVMDFYKKMGAGGGKVFDGREMTSVIFPDAKVRVYIDADLDIRAERALKRDLESGMVVDLDYEKQKVAERDARDMDPSKIGALIKAPGVVVIDTNEMGIESVVERILGLC